MKNLSTKQNPSYQKYSLWATIILILSIGILLISYMVRTNLLIKNQCYQELSASTKRTMEDLEDHFRNDRVSLRALARIISETGDIDSETMKRYLAIYDVSKLISNVAILTPENTCIQLYGETLDTSEILDFETEAHHGEHISGLQSQLTDSESMVIRSFVPIIKNEETIGVLYAEIIPANISHIWTPSIYNGACEFCVINRTTGNCLLTNWKRNIKNLKDFPSQELAERLRNGETSFEEIKLDSDEDLYVSYMPMEIENWEILVTVKKEIVFENVQELQDSMILFLGGEAILLLIYLMWMLYANSYSIANAEKLANIDMLTGLQNRNCYENYCKQIKNQVENLACIYIDANGLHEINNTKGHLAGDQMLRYIADTLKVQFGENTVYRIGGDEFIIFQENSNASQIEQALQNVHTEIERNAYHISAGYCIGKSGNNLKQIIKTAEINMYEEKHRYYEKIGKQVRNKLKEEHS
ncbi:MAG: sensor domain-containing diguanylate cyclase [Oscillospiraceae bacterium]|nr:sensor domain-containing diguanylate cyclase [Oscillospiraceae bacterium]